MIWSILICALEERKDTLLPRVLNELDKQFLKIYDVQEFMSVTLGDGSEGSPKLIRYGYDEAVEVIAISDNRKMSVGTKRNLLLQTKATGKCISFIDDDDMIAPNYCSAILDTIANNPQADVIVFEADRYENGIHDKRVKYSKEYSRDFSDRKFHYRLPNHLMVWKREVALRVPFKEINFGEDGLWARGMKTHIRRQTKIEDVLYYYLFDEKHTATR